MYLTQDELENAPIIDAEGSIVGYAERADLNNKKMILIAFKWIGETEKKVDSEQLILSLVDKFGSHPSARFGKNSRMLLYRRISEELGLRNISEAKNPKNLEKFADKKGVNIPFIKADSRKKEYIKSICWDSILELGNTSQGSCVLLKDPKKNVSSTTENGIQLTFDVKNKMIVDSKARIIGFVEKVVFGAKELGICLKRKKVFLTEKPDIRVLKEESIVDCGNEIRLLGQINKELSLNLQKITSESLLNWAELTERDIPMQIETHVEWEMFESIIEWNQISKIKDVIILKKPAIIEEIE